MADPYYQRSLQDYWRRAARQFPVLLLTGPRQVGKTTFLQHVRERRRAYVTLDDPTVRALAVRDPALFLERFRPPILIDEIQYAPQLLPHIKMISDARRKPGMFWLTGSQQFQVMRGVSETLAGRVGILHMLGFSGRERRQRELRLPPFMPTTRLLQARFGSLEPSTLQQVYREIWTGGFPALVSGIVSDRDLFYSSYMQTYLQRDVKDLAQVGDELSFVRFVRACAARTAQLLNLTDLARDADVSVNTAKHWLSILQGSFQVLLVQPFHQNVTKRLVKTPKLYFLDTGLCAYLTEWSSPKTLEAGAMAGPVFETHVVSEILKSWWHRGRTPSLYFYRDKDGREIDLLIVHNGTLYPIEIKRTASPRPDAVASFSALSRFPLRRGGGALICLVQSPLPLTRSTQAVPVSAI